MKTNVQIEKDALEEMQQLERQNQFKKCLKVVAVVSIGVGLYGFKLGRESGLRKGIEVGYIIAGGDMIDALKEHAQELRLSRGE